MYTNALIGIDELEGGMDAVSLARAITGDAAALTLTRIHGGYATVARGSRNSIREAERRTAEVALRRACLAAGVQNAYAHGAPDVATGLEQLSSQLGSDLIVFGSGPGATYGRSSLPSSLVDLLSRVTCPVAIAPAGYGDRPQRLSRIGVAHEDTPVGDVALVLARRLAEARGAELVVFDRFSDGLNLSRGMAADISRHLVDFSTQVDAIVLGARGGGSLQRMTHASATPSLVRGIACPVIMATTQTRIPRGTTVAAPEQWIAKVTTGVRAL